MILDKKKKVIYLYKKLKNANLPFSRDKSKLNIFNSFWLLIKIIFKKNINLNQNKKNFL